MPFLLFSLIARCEGDRGDGNGEAWGVAKGPKGHGGHYWHIATGGVDGLK